MKSGWIFIFTALVGLESTHPLYAQERKIYHVALTAKQALDLKLPDMNRALRTQKRMDQAAKRSSYVFAPATTGAAIYLFAKNLSILHLTGDLILLALVGITYESWVQVVSKIILNLHHQVPVSSLNVASEIIIGNGNEACLSMGYPMGINLRRSRIDALPIFGGDLSHDQYEFYYFGAPVISEDLDFMSVGSRPHLVFTKLSCLGEHVDLSKTSEVPEVEVK